MERIKQLFLGPNRFYWVSTSILLVWMLVLDSNDITVQFRLWNELRQLENEKVYYQQKKKELEKERRMVIGNPSLLEKFAREKYLMKKPKEDIFVIVDENNQPIER
ncbi:septum formation initiator family protein [Aquirufa sp.]|jgi:cell division protein DivIC|uniref:septum formation initiator family protein n=1 Tax=Aquirufa sp. TaxID=2676249 RepID=UPI0037BFAFD1